MSPINYGSTKTPLLSFKDVESWSSEEVASYLQSKENIADYGALFRSNKIDGSIAHRLTDADLQSMGISAVGDRHRVLAALEDLRNAKEQSDRERILWVGREELHWSWVDRAYQTKCGLCREDPEEYTLRFNYLDIQRPESNRCCGFIDCCFGKSYHIDTIDLCNVDDVDVDGVPPPFALECFCCATPHEHVLINAVHHESHLPAGVTILKLKKGVGQEVKRKIQNQVEIMQEMERG